ncbi:MAG: chromosomal replication initiator protein DnaA [Myxococcales bacterium]
MDFVFSNARRSLMPSLDDKQVKEAFRRVIGGTRLSAEYVQRWVSRIRCDGLSAEGELQLAIGSKFYRDFITDHFLRDILAGMHDELSVELPVDWVIDESLKPEAPLPDQPPPRFAQPAPATVAPVTAPGSASGADQAPYCRLDERYTFDTFVSAPSNQLACAGAIALAEKPGSTFNPLFIYGGTGLGKTHLLHAIGNRLLQLDPSRRIIYLSSEQFLNEYILFVRENRMPEFRRKYRDECDCLLIDDIQFLSSKESTQEEFFHTFNALYSLGKPVAITSDTIPAEIPGIADRLRTRFASGLTADIQEPDYETRVAILKKKAEGLGLSLPDPVAHYIASVVQKNVRELQMALNRVFAHHSLTGQPLTVDLAAHILKNVLPASRPLEIEEVQKEVAKYYNISLEDLRGPRRQKQLVRARHVAVFLCRKLTGNSFPEIGARFKRDHSTVISSCEKVEKEMGSDLQLKKEIDEFVSRLAR